MNNVFSRTYSLRRIETCAHVCNGLLLFAFIATPVV